ncbi:MAG: peptidylprolyl isomerase [Ignavibacteriaceae bacterium]
MKGSIFFLLLLTLFFGCNNSNNTTKNNDEMNVQKNKNKMEKTAMPDSTKKMDVAVIKTNMGTIEIQLFSEVAPKAVENFEGLAKKGYYDGVTFHRVIDNFMIQGGDPTGTGRGGESIWGKPFEDEFSPDYTFDKPGILAMANAGPGTNGSQFFITLVPTPWLNNHHTIFGKVIKGMDVVQAIGKVEITKPYDKPVKDVVMEKVTVEQK